MAHILRSATPPSFSPCGDWGRFGALSPTKLTMRPLLLACLLLTGCAAAPAPLPSPPSIPAGEDPGRWTTDVATLAAQPSPAPHPVVFVGSSSIRLWDTLADDMAPMPVLNCGFGGSKIFDSVYWAEELVSQREPAVVVVFAGTNDLAGGSPRQPEWLVERFDELVARLRVLGCAAPLVYIAISPTPSRAEHQALVEETNRLIATRCASDPRLTFVDTASALLDGAGRPDPRWFREDRLHLGPEGYALWAAQLRPVVLELFEAQR